MQIKYLFTILIFFLLNGCQAVQDGSAGNKSENSDEFLIEKKNPLEIPPDFGVLPEPNKKKDMKDQAEKIDEDIEKLFENSNTGNNTQSQNKSAEEFVLKQIKKN